MLHGKLKRMGNETKRIQELVLLKNIYPILNGMKKRLLGGEMNYLNFQKNLGI